MTGSLAALGRLLVAAACLAGLAGCTLFKAPPLGPEALSRVEAARAAPVSDDLDAESLKIAISQSLRYLKRLNPERPFRLGSDTVTAAGMIASLEAALALLEEYGLGPEFYRALAADFQFYGLPGPVLFTGYYEPLLEGRRKPEGRFTTPLFKRPDDMVYIDLADFGLQKKRLTGRLAGRKVVPYHTRSEIDAGALAGKGLELAWVDPVEAFFLHIQGSGQVVFPDGSRIRVNYAAQNGHPYVSLGRVMIERGLLRREEISLQSLKAYLNDHPDEMAELLNTNPSYVFFRIVEEGPLGSLNVPVTPGRSVALDRRIFPGAALALIRTDKPVIRDGSITAWEPFTRLVLIQDTGGAIKGPGRCDLFFGAGKEAELAAGHMKQTGELFVLVHKDVLN